MKGVKCDLTGIVDCGLLSGDLFGILHKEGLNIECGLLKCDQNETWNLKLET